MLATWLCEKNTSYYGEQLESEPVARILAHTHAHAHTQRTAFSIHL